ncbi:MAG: LLM class flavin-dependent oxidoreductase [Pseudomonadota bacterium]
MLTVPNFGLWYDFRYSCNTSVSREQSYKDHLEHIIAAEALGFDSIWLTEHHFQTDGYTPSPLVIAAAIGAATKRLRIGTNLALLPLYDPVRLAEDAATLSLLTEGRFDLGVGAGYVEREYAVFGRNLKHRPSLMEEGISIIRQAWSGQPVNLKGKRFTVNELMVRPIPERPPRLLMGAVAPVAIERAARLADGFLDSGGIGQDHYLQSLAAAGQRSDQAAIFCGCWDIVCEAPERARTELGPCLLRQMRSYQSMGAFPGSIIQTAEQAIELGFYRFLTPEQMSDAVYQQVCRYPQTKDIHFWGRFPGEHAASALRRVELLSRSVLPDVRQKLQAVPSGLLGPNQTAS